MNSGMYAALSGNLTAMKRLDALANNLANVNTPGFKRDSLRFERVLSTAGSQSVDGSVEPPDLVSEAYAIDYSSGLIKRTDNTLDLAIDGDGFFVVNTPEGKAYTRQGNFRLDKSGKLVTVDGLEVLGSGGPITINGGNVSFDTQGKIMVEGVETGAIKIVDFPKPYDLRKLGGGLFVPNDPNVTPQASGSVSLRQGHLESSNVNAITEMVSLIDASRSFETCQRVVQTYDSITGKAVNELGKV
jgi:flagellar basal-body rod protein FlgF